MVRHQCELHDNQMLKPPKIMFLFLFFVSPACNKGKMVCHHEACETDPSRYLTEQFPKLWHFLGVVLKTHVGTVPGTVQGTPQNE